ncbi:hypothetical protein DNHGIG_00070 [Collibacillus ludicampi]|uniref:Site-specific integrase n=1 Tax=Collibacillus ludicampi TaxID=2771369 RepID=A0AAV4L9T8_9BACL|nr:site-specific integrase [Collibacillus ludicampi]GIM44458.1 hypothetical protein DNHGIG_00070 [Collibacillus ludicampi]
MASIEKRGKNSYRLVVELGYDANGKRIRRSKTVHVKTKREAEKELAKFVTEIESGEYIAPEKMSFKNFVENEWLKKYAEKELALTTLNKYTSHFRSHILPFFGHKQLNDIKTLYIINFFNEIQKEGERKDGKSGQLSEITVRDIYTILRSVFSNAVEWRVIPNNPMDGVKRPKVGKRNPNFYETDETQEIIRALYDEPASWRLYFLGAMLGGFRRGELTALEWTDVDFDENTITIRKSISYTLQGKAVVKGTKTNEYERIVVMPEWYMRELRKYYTEWKKERLLVGDLWEGGDKQYVFHGGTGKPYYYTTPTKRWRKFLAKHDFRYIRLHDLRHTAATLLIEAGVDLKAIQERLGHSTYQVTADIYAHVTKKVNKAAADKLERLAPKNLVPNSSP